MIPMPATSYTCRACVARPYVHSPRVPVSRVLCEKWDLKGHGFQPCRNLKHSVIPSEQDDSQSESSCGVEEPAFAVPCRIGGRRRALLLLIALRRIAEARGGIANESIPGAGRPKSWRR